MHRKIDQGILAGLIAAGLLAGCGEDGSAAPERVSDATAIAGVAAVAAVAGATAPDPVAKAPGSNASRPVPGRYIVTFTPAVADPAAEAPGLVAQSGGTLHFTYTQALRGFSASLPDAAVNALRNNPRIAAVEVDQTVSVRQTTQSPATWGLDRVDQRALPLDTAYRYATTSTGVTAFVVDTGIRSSHLEFREALGSAIGRVGAGYTAIADGLGTEDCDGHGTHVAGTIGGLTYGVAKQVRLVPVRVLDCTGSGTWSGVIAGLDYVARSTARPAVANLSLGGGVSSAVDTAVANTVAAGVTVAVAAGNSALDACGTSPARAPSAITVGSTTSTDARSSFSNFGTCLDLFAPGSAITSAVIGSDTATASYSGTSMASPHVAGAAALVLQGSPSLTPAQVWERIKAIATADRVTSPGTGSPNLLLFTNPSNEPQPVMTAVSVAGLSATAANFNSSNWRATVTISVRNASGAGAPGVRVTGGFTVGGSPLICTTDGNGVCRVTSGNIHRRTLSTRYSVTGLSGTALQYDSAANTVSTITVARP